MNTPQAMDVGSLIRQLHEIEQQLGSGEVDAVIGPTGQTYLLRQAQERLRRSESEQRSAAVLQTAVLDALPAHVALLDAGGVIVTVNESWRDFAKANGLVAPDFAVGQSYPGMCEAVVGAGRDEAQRAARGIRSVLRGEQSGFQLEYACHAPTEQRWYRMTVSPMVGDAGRQAVVMHVDISERRRAELEKEHRGQRMGALVDAQRELASSDATLDALIARIPDLALSVVEAGAAVFDVIEGDEMVCRAGSAEAVSAVGLRIPVDQGFSGEAVRANRTLRCDDTALDTRVAAAACLAYGVRSVLATVVRDRNGPIGVLKMLDRQPAHFGASEADGLELLAEALGAVFQRKRAEEEARQSLRTQQGIVHLQQEITAAPAGLQSILDTIAVRTKDLVGATGSMIVLADGQELVYRAVSGIAVKHLGLRIPSTGSFAGATVRQGELLRCDDSATDPRVDNALCMGLGFRSILMAPLRAGQQVVGTLSVVSGEPSAFGPREAGTLQILAEWLGVVMQRATAAARLRSSEAEYRLVFANNPMPMWVYDVETLRFLAVNDAAIAKYGYSGAEFMAMTVRDIRSEDEVDAFVEYLAARGDGAQIKRAWMHRAKDGTMFEVETSSNAIAFGARPARLVLANDVSKRRRAERRLQRSEAVLAIAGRAAHVAGWSVDLKRRIFEYTEDLCAQQDLPPSHSVTIEQVLDFYVPESRARLVKVVNACARDGTPYDIELDRVTPAGRRIAVRTIGHAVRSGTGEIVGIQGAAQDITSQRAAQEELRSLNESLEAKVAERTAQLELTHSALVSKEEEVRSVVRHMADCVINFDDQGVIRSANPMTETIFGYAEADIVGRNVASIVPALASRDASVGAGMATREARGLRRNGEGIALEVSLGQYSLKGQRLWTAILRDVGERIRIMADLEQARNDAEQASRAKSAFVATMSHEIRTPMNGVIGMIDVLEQTELQPEQSKMIGLARESAYSLMGVIDDILDFSKIEAGKIELECQPVAISEVVESVAAVIGGVASSKGVALKVASHPSVPYSVWGDALRVRQVLINLVNNAVKFSAGRAEPGSVSVAVTVGRRSADRVVLHIAVADNGIGMDAATVASLFKPFSQADATTTRRFGGTGLGLTISRQLVELMGGEIRVSSTLGLGSTFTVLLPFEVASEVADVKPVMAAPAPVAAQPGPVAGRRSTALRPELILVAEDNSTNRQVVIAQLKLLGFSAVVAVDGVEALERWRSGEFAMLFTDLQMPEMDGYGLAAQIRSEEAAGARIPIVALTANALREESDRCLAAGMDGYLTKPVRLSLLRDALDRWLPGDGLPGAAPSDGPTRPVAGPVDPGVLPQLVGDDPEVLRGFYLDFMHSAGEARAALEIAMAGGDGVEVAAVAHRLKASASAVGALRLAALFAELEKQKDPAARVTSWRLLKAELALVNGWIEAHHVAPADAAPMAAG